MCNTVQLISHHSYIQYKTIQQNKSDLTTLKKPLFATFPILL